MPPGKQDDPAKVLAGLIRRGLDRKGWSVDAAAAAAAKMALRGLSARNIREYLAARRKRTPGELIIRRFALLFGELEDTWLAHFPGFGLDHLLLKRETVIQEQERLEEEDEVILVSSRPFLEASDIEISSLVLRNLNRGVAYTYYFPMGDANPFHLDAARSYEQFRQRAANHRFGRSPMLFGYAVNASLFRYFSGLHTLVRHSSRIPGNSRTYVYIELAQGESGRTAQAWYLLPDEVWRQIDANLREARSDVSDTDLPIVPLNPRLRTVRKDYLGWFGQDDSPARYGSLRPLLGHSESRCVRALLTEVTRTTFEAGRLRFLDVGCGDGVITHSIASALGQRYPASVVGIDASGPQIRSAQTVLKSSPNLECRAIESELETFQTEDSFDLITAVHSLYTIDEAYVRRLYQLLTPGGIVCIWMAMRRQNVISSVCDALDAVLRPGQLRNTAEDVERYGIRAGLSPRLIPYPGEIPCLLDAKGHPTVQAKSLIDFCALKTVRRNSAEWNAAVEALGGPERQEALDHPLTDGLIVIQRRR